MDNRIELQAQPGYVLTDGAIFVQSISFPKQSQRINDFYEITEKEREQRLAELQKKYEEKINEQE